MYNGYYCSYISIDKVSFIVGIKASFILKYTQYNSFMSLKDIGITNILLLFYLILNPSADANNLIC